MKILNVVNTTYELYYVSAVGCLLKEMQPEITLRLLTRPHIARTLPVELKQLYADVQALHFIEDNGRILDGVRKSLAFRRHLHWLDLRADVVCISSFRQYFANMLCRQLKGQARLVALRHADHACDASCDLEKPNEARHFNTINRIFGASTMEYRWHRDTAHVCARWYRNDPYDRTICYSDWGHEVNGTDYRLPPPFVALRHLYRKADGRASGAKAEQPPTVLVLGERTPLCEGWTSEQQSIYETLFDSLRANFRKHRLLFKPRSELTRLDELPLDGFDMLPDTVSLEELLLRNSYDRVISVKSTGSKLGAALGHPSYWLYPMFSFPEVLRNSFEGYLEDMRSVTRVSDLSQLQEDSSVAIETDLERLGNQYVRAVLE